MRTVKDDLELLQHALETIPGPIYVFQELSDTTKNVINAAGFPHFSGLEYHILLYKNDKDWLVSALKLIAEE